MCGKNQYNTYNQLDFFFIFSGTRLTKVIKHTNNNFRKICGFKEIAFTFGGQ